MNRTMTRRTATGALAIAALMLAGCGSGSSTNDDASRASVAEGASEKTATAAGSSDVEVADDDASTRTFEAQNGAIEIPVEPQRIVTCGYATLPLLQAEANLVASCEWTREINDMSPDVRAAYDAIPRVGADADASTLNYEAIAVADPDLIILGVPVFALEDIDMTILESLAPVVMIGPTKPSEWRILGEQYADAANVVDEYGAFKGRYEVLAADIASRYETLDGISFGGICSVCAGDDGTFTREYASSYVTNLFDELGFSVPGQPIDSEGPQHAETLSIENLSESFADVDVIVYGLDADGNIPPTAQSLFDSPLWQSLPAVQAGNVIAVEHSSASTYETAILALQSIDASLAALPAYADQ